MKTAMFLLLLLIAGPAFCEDEKKDGLGAVFIVDQGGKLDNGVAYPIAKWRSITNKDKIAEFLAIVAQRQVALGICREFWVQKKEDKRLSISIGIGVSAPFAQKEGDSARVILFGLGRLK